jgi:hypothetical protein
MIVCSFDNYQWRWALNDRLALARLRGGDATVELEDVLAVIDLTYAVRH